MKSIGVRELKNAASEVLREVERGERFLVTNQGRAVAQLVPVEPAAWRPWAEVADVFTGPGDPTLLQDLALLGGDLVDPWEPS